MRQRSGVDITADEVLQSPHVFIGSVEGLTEKILECGNGSVSARS